MPSKRLLIKLVNAGKNEIAVPVELKDIALNQVDSGTWEVLTADELYSYNSMSAPGNIKPKFINFGLNSNKKPLLKTKNMNLPKISGKGQRLLLTLPPYSVNLVALPVDLPGKSSHP